MASNAAPSLLPGQSPPLTVITATDQTGVVLIATALCMIFALISMIIRAFVRLEFRHQISRDDIAATLAMVFSIVQSSTVFIAVSKGFGKTLSDINSADLVPLQKASYASDLLYIVTLWFAKCSVAFLFRRLSPNKRDVMASNAILLTTTLTMIVSLFIVALRCDMAHPWIFINEKCTALFVRWQVVAAFDIITEIGLFAASIYLVHDLQLSFAKKSLVIVAFAIRLPVIVAIALRLHYLNREISSSNPTLDGVIACVWTQIQIMYAIIAATTPCLRPFMSALNTHYGAPAEPKTTPSGSKMGTGQSENIISLNSVSKMSRSGRSEKGKDVWTPPTIRQDIPAHHTAVVSGDRQSLESHESKQMIISKNTEWVVEYEGQSQMHDA